MNFNKDFFLGLFAGLALGAFVAIALFNFFIVRTIENTKQEAKDFVTNSREMLRSEVKEELATFKEKGKNYLDENKEEILDNIKERIKDRFENKQDTVKVK